MVFFFFCQIAKYDGRYENITEMFVIFECNILWRVRRGKNATCILSNQSGVINNLGVNISSTQYPQPDQPPSLLSSA